MKIGLVRRGYSRTGGAEIYLRRFAETATAAGHECVLFTEQWPRLAWPYAHVPIKSRSPRSFSEALPRFHPQEKCDVLFSFERIQTCDVYRAGDGVHAAWLQLRARFEPFWKPWLRQFNGKHREMLALEKALFSPEGARQVIANSHLIQREIVEHFGFPENRIQVVHNGVPPLELPVGARARVRRELGLSEDAFAVIFTGSGWERKGLRFAIQAINAAKIPHATLLVAGRGSQRGLPKSGRVRFLGPVNDILTYLAAADAFILPTLYEPFSNACLEALTAGLPVITTRYNGFAEIIDPGEEGEAVPEPDDIPALAAALEKWSDPDRRTTIRPRLLALGSQHGIEQNVRQTLKIIEAARQL
jgi:UDP-glucose:(heptosyl)LPS alpha-1,3-glucosyltransferase